MVNRWKSIKYEFLFLHGSCVFNYFWTKMVGLCAITSKKVIGIVPDLKQLHNQHDLYIVPLFRIWSHICSSGVLIAQELTIPWRATSFVYLPNKIYRGFWSLTRWAVEVIIFSVEYVVTQRTGKDFLCQVLIWPSWDIPFAKSQDVLEWSRHQWRVWYLSQFSVITLRLLARAPAMLCKTGGASKWLSSFSNYTCTMDLQECGSTWPQHWSLVIAT